ncbi:peptidoglycan DD-metalloendopeptidase family protein [Oscillibacter sp.]|uniref:peptidoglycan DD-metalloendopeptidase family protein n=1 Tax=Oscillibacter sp. TaxID=1945593 RepID=UPI00260B289E|nr:M23 family metallopeptidase [Oscillibacter sp.]MDD3347198.1 M23 family metallopeptidase [Oscillibacter sp.]
MSQDLKKEKDPPSRGGRRLTQEQLRHSRESSHRDASRGEKDRSFAQTAVKERPAERPAERAGSRAASSQREDRQRGEGAARRKREELHPLSALYLAAEHEWTRARRRWRHIVREKKAHRFPESERLPVQLLLFGWCMLPMLGSLLEERLWGRRRRAAGKTTQVHHWLENHKVHPAPFLGGACGIVAAVAFFSIYTVGTTVSYDGQIIAAVSSQSIAESVRSDLERVTTRTLGESFTIDDSLIRYSSGLLKRQEVVDNATFEEDLSEEIGLVTSAYCLYVDGERIGATPYQDALEELLAQLKTASTDAETISCEFAEKVEIKQEYVPTEEIMNLGYLAEMLYSTKTAEVTYEVKKGDTWSQIANSHDLTSKELLALNPGYNIEKLQIGEVLTLSASVPYLTLTVVERERYVDDVDFDVVYTDSPNMWKNDEKVTSAGQYGAADVVANVTYVNGEETERTILSSVTLRQAVTEQRLRGTKERPTWHPTGTFRWPTTGRITSSFGGRKSPGGIGSSNHKGIDIAGRYGSPIYAADGGTVTYAGWMGGYGYLVQIDHGNGYVTYYGHNSSLIVSVGQHVYKGQQIAKMGSTGNSTGNHCHFEVRYNGVARNPLNYLQ